jgi:ParB-like chromosome segregation protein Spo0J
VLSAPSPSHQSAEFFADSLQTFGFTNPVLIGDDDEIIAGHGRVEAAKLLRMESEIN